eukprot:TRINITY_DN5571_c0_g1_i12.p1 TRINITY_DN5571_c0_g1~~TRINITY_DN5571_c0_g1_i12.p1  ORF type:complete len:695 (+),score=193.25 TRINITY_DN5571_c0_g1_i12:402-2486(+)
MFPCEVQPEQFVFKQGDDASSFFILETGALQVIINDAVKRQVRPGEGFGELALLYNAPRSASVKATERSTMWAIDRISFKKTIEDMMTKEFDENRAFLDNVRFFDSMTADQKDSIAMVMFTQNFTAGTNIVNEGDQASSFYIVKDGTLSVLKGNNEVRKLYKGDSFGEQALYFNTNRGMTIRAETNSKVLALGRDSVQKIFGNQIQSIVFRNIEKWAMDKHPLLNKLNKVQVEKICDNLKLTQKHAGDVIFQKGSTFSKIVFALESALKKSRQGTIVVPKGGLYGEDSLSENYKSTKQPLDDDVVLESDSYVAEIDTSQFTQIIGGHLEAIVKKNVEFENKMQDKQAKTEQDVKNESATVKLETLIFIKKLGAGMFGNVYLVKSREVDKLYALKCVSKVQILNQNLQKYLVQEKVVLGMISNPFIMQFIRTFKDSNFIYFLTEFIRGMEMFDAIREIGLLNTSESQFYCASLILGLEYLHSQNIIYRDLKPENVMVDDRGYVRLIDLGTAKIMKNKSARTFTIIGTPHYMAPEVLTGKGYTLNVDLWSIGVCLYEFVCGQVPFGEEAEEPYDIYEEIIKKDVKYPSFLKDKKAKKFLDQLLSKIPEQRLGTSYAALKAHAWFDNFDWDRLMEKEMRPFWLPPKEKLFPEIEIKKMEGVGKLVLTEIQNDIKIDKKASNSKKQIKADPDLSLIHI